MRIALHSRTVAGAETAYDATHRVIPDDLAQRFGELGIHNWTIWRSGSDLMHLVECDDFDAAMTALEDDPANARWQATIGVHVDHFELSGNGYGGMVVPEVWSLKQQLAT